MSRSQLDDQEEPQLRPPGRVRAAWRVLRGQSLVPDQILAEWLEYQLIFNDLLTRLSAQLARAAKSERKRLRRLAEDASPSDSQSAPQLSLLPHGQASTKSQLRAQAADRMGLGPLRARLASSQSSPPPEAPQ